MNKLIKKLTSSYLTGKKGLEEIDALRLKGKKPLKAFIFSTLSGLIIALPFALIIITLYSQYSPVMVFYYLLSFITICLLVVLNAVISVLYIKLLQNYYEDESVLPKICLSNVFVKELFSPLNILIIFIFIFILTLF